MAPRTPGWEVPGTTSQLVALTSRRGVVPKSGRAALFLLRTTATALRRAATAVIQQVTALPVNSGAVKPAMAAGKAALATTLRRTTRPITLNTTRASTLSSKPVPLRTNSRHALTRLPHSHFIALSRSLPGPNLAASSFTAYAACILTSVLIVAQAASRFVCDKN